MIGIWRKWFEILREYFKGKSVDYLIEEERVLTNFFNLILFSPLVGIPLIPPILSIELLPFSLSEIERLEERERGSDDLFWQIASIFEPT